MGNTCTHSCTFTVMLQYNDYKLKRNRRNLDAPLEMTVRVIYWAEYAVF